MLVITVVETMPVFLGGELAVGGTGGPTPPYVSVTPSVVALIPEFGGRFFFRGQNEVTLNLNGSAMTYDRTMGFGAPSTPAFEIGYTHHNLFGRHLVGAVSLGGKPSIGQDAGSQQDALLVGAGRLARRGRLE